MNGTNTHKKTINPTTNPIFTLRSIINVYFEVGIHEYFSNVPVQIFIAII